MELGFSCSVAAIQDAATKEMRMLLSLLYTFLRVISESFLRVRHNARSDLKIAALLRIN